MEGAESIMIPESQENGDEISEIDESINPEIEESLVSDEEGEEDLPMVVEPPKKQQKLLPKGSLSHLKRKRICQRL